MKKSPTSLGLGPGDRTCPKAIAHSATDARNTFDAGATIKHNFSDEKFNKPPHLVSARLLPAKRSTHVAQAHAKTPTDKTHKIKATD